MAPWVVVVTCKLELVVVVICKLVRDDKVLVKGGMASLVVGEMSIDSLLSFRKLS
uniref:Extensin (ext) n=1 Tax=Solanum tuberosum TaxID=4113 RepID=M0ZJK9_SOLTU